MRRLWWVLGAFAAGLALFEVAMQPSWSERLELATIFTMMLVAMVLAARWLPRVARRYSSIRVTLAVLALTAFAIVAAGALGVGIRMFLSTHDLTLLLVVVGFGVVAAVGFALSVSAPLSDDLDRLSDRAREVAIGLLDTEDLIDRRDEVGRLSESIDRMISQLREAEERRRAHEESRRSFFAAVGHDLRTPLSSMRAALEAVQDGVVADPGRYLASMERDVAALTALVEDIFLLAKLDAGALEMPISAVDVTELADEAIEALAPLAAERSLIIDLRAEDRVIATSSSEAVSRVLRNLIDNAIRHAPPTSTVVVDVSNESASASIRVLDEGEGFDADFVPIAFNRFTRADAARARDGGGSGLGLAIAGELVTALHGRIWAEPGPGGRVSVELPTGTAPGGPGGP